MLPQVMQKGIWTFFLSALLSPQHKILFFNIICRVPFFFFGLNKILMKLLLMRALSKPSNYCHNIPWCLWSMRTPLAEWGLKLRSSCSPVLQYGKKRSEGYGKVIRMIQKKFLCRELKTAGLSKYFHSQCWVYPEDKMSFPPHRHKNDTWMKKEGLLLALHKCLQVPSMQL